MPRVRQTEVVRVRRTLGTGQLAARGDQTGAGGADVLAPSTPQEDAGGAPIRGALAVALGRMDRARLGGD